MTKVDDYIYWGLRHRTTAISSGQAINWYLNDGKANNCTGRERHAPTRTAMRSRSRQMLDKNESPSTSFWSLYYNQDVHGPQMGSTCVGYRKCWLRIAFSVHIYYNIFSLFILVSGTLWSGHFAVRPVLAAVRFTNDYQGYYKRASIFHWQGRSDQNIQGVRTDIQTIFLHQKTRLIFANWGFCKSGAGRWNWMNVCCLKTLLQRRQCANPLHISQIKPPPARLVLQQQQ